MMKKIVSGCLLFVALVSIQNVNAASTCDYSEQVELNNIASTVKGYYTIEKKVMNVNGNVEEGIDPNDSRIEDVDSAYYVQTVANVSINNLTSDIYMVVTNNKGFSNTYHYDNTLNGEVSIFAGELNEVVTYTVTIYSNRSNCPDEELRKMEIVVPMRNEYALSSMCARIPDYEYCKEYIVAPFLADSSTITNSISKEYEKYSKDLQEQEEKQNQSFFEKIEEFIKENKIIIYSVLGIIIIAGVIVTIVILKKKRSRVL